MKSTNITDSEEEEKGNTVKCVFHIFYLLDLDKLITIILLEALF
jgi:hypothetical protein